MSLTDPDLFDICAGRHCGSPESTLANAAACPGKAVQRWRIFKLIKEHERFGLTVDDAAVMLGTSPNAVSGRFTELKRLGLIAKVGRRQTRSGCAAGVYRAV